MTPLLSECVTRWPGLTDRSIGLVLFERRLYIVVLFVYAAVCGEATAASTHSHSPTRHTLTLGQDSLATLWRHFLMHRVLHLVSVFDMQGTPLL